MVQTVFTKAYQNMDRLQDVRAIKSWLITIATNEGKTFLRKKYSEKGFRERFEFWTKQLFTESEPLDPTLTDTVKAYIEKLPDDDTKKIVMLFYYDQKKVSDISKLLDMNVSTVTTKLNRFRTKMKTELLEKLNTLRGDYV